MTEEQKPTQTADPAKPEAKTEAEAPKADELLGLLKQTLKREFGSREDAIKTLENLNQMVGDQAIADLREKAKEADNFNAVVKAYSEQEGLSLAEARKAILEDLSPKTQKPMETVQKPAETTDPLASVKAEVDSIRLQFEEKELLVEHPEAKAVLNEIRGLAKAQGKPLKEVYVGSALKEMATKVAAVEKEKAEAASTSLPSNSRQGLDVKEHADLIDRVRKDGNAVDKQALVAKALGLTK